MFALADVMDLLADKLTRLRRGRPSFGGIAPGTL